MTVFIGPQGLGAWQMLELRSIIQEFVDTGKRVIPVLLPGVTSFPSNLRFLRQFNWVQFKEQLDEPGALEPLEWGIMGKKPLRESMSRSTGG
jgi:hypothetical protein